MLSVLATQTWKPKPKDLADLSSSPQLAVQEGQEMVRELELEIARAYYREMFPIKEQDTLTNAAAKHEGVENFPQVGTAGESFSRI